MNIFGAVLITGTSFVIGVLLSRVEGEKMKALDSLLSLFTSLRRKIAAERIPILAFFSHYDDAFLSKYGFFKRFFAENSSVSSRLRSAISELPLGKDVRDELTELSKTLGMLPLEPQLLRLDSTVELLKNAREELRTSLPKKQKSQKTVCLLSGLMLSILLL